MIAGLFHGADLRSCSDSGITELDVTSLAHIGETQPPRLPAPR
jgi:hypothetical protein